MENRHLQTHDPQDLVPEEDFRSEAEQHIGKVVIAFGASIPLMVATQFLQLGMPGLVISGVLVAVVAVGGKKSLKVLGYIPGVRLAIAQVPTIHWGRLIGIPDETDESNVVDADPIDQEQDGQAPYNQEHQDPQPAQAENIDAIFQAYQAPVSTILIARLRPNDIIRNSTLDTYKICIGRSLTRKDNPPIWINFYKRHLKLIGVSQYGKSSMAAAIIYLITRTHAPEKVLIALLDLEYKTSKLFEDIPHLAQVSIDGKKITLHAKSYEQVLEHLGYIVAIVDERYKLSEDQIEQEPLLLVYLEEFLDLKDHFKARKDQTEEYSQLIHHVNRIARRGLKVKVQFLLCAQVDYRDTDFQEALVNINSGMSFCVVATAARAAGFVSTPLLNQNVEMDERGVAVVETPDCKDLVHVLDFDLEKKLIALANAQQGQRPLREQRPGILVVKGSENQDHAPQPEAAAQEQPEMEDLPSANPNIRKLTHLHRRVLEHYQPGLGYRDLGELIGTGKDKAGELLKDLRDWGFIAKEKQS